MKTSFVKAVLAFVLCLFAMSAMADIGTDMKNKFDNLTPQQQAELYKQVTDQVQKNKDNADEQKTSVTIDKVQQYSQLGTTIGAALAGTAKELGVVANDFLKTPVGLMAAALIVWKMVGATLVHVFGGVAFMMVFLPIWYIAFKRHCLVETVTISTDEKGKKTKVIKNRNGSEVSGWYWFLFIIAIITTNIIVFTF